jgi:hypothetical protein
VLRRALLSICTADRTEVNPGIIPPSSDQKRDDEPSDAQLKSTL